MSTRAKVAPPAARSLASSSPAATIHSRSAGDCACSKRRCTSRSRPSEASAWPVAASARAFSHCARAIHGQAATGANTGASTSRAPGSKCAHSASATATTSAVRPSASSASTCRNQAEARCSCRSGEALSAGVLSGSSRATSASASARADAAVARLAKRGEGSGRSMSCNLVSWLGLCASFSPPACLPALHQNESSSRAFTTRSRCSAMRRIRSSGSGSS